LAAFSFLAIFDAELLLRLEDASPGQGYGDSLLPQTLDSESVGGASRALNWSSSRVSKDWCLAMMLPPTARPANKGSGAL
jgi:hypothetical protein